MGLKSDIDKAIDEYRRAKTAHEEAVSQEALADTRLNVARRTRHETYEARQRAHGALVAALALADVDE